MKSRPSITGILALVLSSTVPATPHADTVRARVSANLDRIADYRADAIVWLDGG
ncbi:MAG: hypothetical protein GF344_13130 [Chitinivibrionales bacterium]|nr:hypothetical protein [Chitinivibrionales bacterium]MBD3357677.1 hypothetical protein [Chitinivibrionales bacterium]